MRQAKMIGALLVLLLAANAYADDIPAGVQTRKAKSGNMVFADMKGMTLYTYDQDAQGKSNCSGNCARSWPPFMAQDNAMPAGDWTVVTRADNSKQWAYKGKPLYYWMNDHNPGDTTGDGMGGVWHIASAEEGAQTPPSTTQQPSSGSYGYGEEANGPGTRPNYPGIPPSSGKLETQVGSYSVRFYGTVLMNMSASDAGVFGQDLPLWALPSNGTVTYPDGTTGTSRDNHDLIFTMRQSVLGLTLNPASPSTSGWNPSALVEMDFFGTRPVDTSEPQDRTLDQPRLRMAYLQLEHNGIKIVAGQDKMILSPLDPVSLSHVAAPLGATAGDLWGWFPQVRVDFAHKMHDTGILFQLGVLRPQFGDSKLETAPAVSTSIDTQTSGLGERTTQPFYQARIAISPKLMGRTSTIGVSAHFGQEKIGVNNNLQSWATALDLDVPISSRIILRGEGFAGSNLIPFQGGIDQGAGVVAAGGGAFFVRRIGAGGGWSELTLLPTLSGRDAVYLGAGTDDPASSTLFGAANRDKNSFLWASYFHKFNDSVTAALEWSNWQFKTLAAKGRANVFNLSLAYQF